MCNELCKCPVCGNWITVIWFGYMYEDVMMCRSCLETKLEAHYTQEEIPDSIERKKVDAETYFEEGEEVLI